MTRRYLQVPFAAVFVLFSPSAVLAQSPSPTPRCDYCAFYGEDGGGRSQGKYCKAVTDGAGWRDCYSFPARCVDPPELSSMDPNCRIVEYACSAPGPSNCQRTPPRRRGGPIGGPDEGDIDCPDYDNDGWCDDEYTSDGEGGESAPALCHRDVCDNETFSVDDYCEGSNQVCETCSVSWEECDWDWGYCWTNYGEETCNCHDEPYGYVCGSHEETHETNCRSETYVCGGDE